MFCRTFDDWIFVKLTVRRCGSCCRTVQLLWHQLRVSVLVLKERLLQGLQDSNGNYTRQTDILQAFGQDQHQVTHTPSCWTLNITVDSVPFGLLVLVI